MGHSPVNSRVLPAFLLTVCVIPTGAGIYRAAEIIDTGKFAMEFATTHVDRLPLLLHAVFAIGFLLLATFQVWPGFRRKHPRFHRRSGKITVVSGMLGALSGLWMTLLHPDISSGLLHAGRIGASLFWVFALFMAVRAIMRREFKIHGAWMIRAYAIALPAGTLALILFPMVLILGEDGHEMLFEIVQVAAWPLHVAVAEWIIRKGQKPRPQTVRLLPA